MDATIAELQRAMRNGRITSVELVDFGIGDGDGVHAYVKRGGAPPCR